MQANFQPVAEPAPPRPINLRVWVVVLLFMLIIGYPVGAFVRQQLNHGISRQGDLYHVDLKAMGYFPFPNPGGTLANVPPRWRALDGKTVELEGYMTNGRSAGRRVCSFEFVYDINRCCFNGPPLVQERVFAHVIGNQDVSIDSQKLMRIRGTLHLNLSNDENGSVTELYTMDVINTEPVN